MATPKAKTSIHFAYSPDSDDAFMAEALTASSLESPLIEWRFSSAEIHELNMDARRGRFDVTALSAAAYPAVAKDYVVLPVGASFGDGYGPSIVVPDNSPITDPMDLRGRRVAVPGATTTAAMAMAAILGSESGYGEYVMVETPFLEVTTAVAQGRAEAGILIHELQMNDRIETANGTILRRIGNLGTLWQKRYGLPLPLGIIAAKRTLGPAILAEVTRLQRESIRAGLADRQRTLNIATTKAMAPVSGHDADRYIRMYVNDRTLDFGEDGRRSLSILFETCWRLQSHSGVMPADWLFRDEMARS